ncbi:helix-turn-helix domain-containing protein [Actinomadura litoris]|uniref:helix-turn-helix domain-containing protein n=1 Tax=Actinomadura litoris TaxID=2678616 RepID=UPI001FA7A24B|nr:helix-turn-helix transcriptional regulator [Actinomadura litoris]
MSVRETIDPNSSHWAWLAFDLWFHRTQRGLSLAQTALIVRVTRATVSNWEAGRFRPGDEHMALLDKAWDTGGHFQRLLYYARTGHDPDWFKQYIQYERAAEIIKIYHGKVIPALVQTEDYRCALLVVAGREHEIGAEAEARKKRQEILERSDSPYVWILLDQEAVECQVGSRDVMRAQLQSLLDLVDHPRVVIRIIPRSAGAHPGQDGAFHILTLGPRTIAYAGAQIGGRLIEAGDEVSTLAVRFDQIGAHAWSKSASREFIEQEMRKYE